MPSESELALRVQRLEELLKSCREQSINFMRQRDERDGRIHALEIMLRDTQGKYLLLAQNMEQQRRVAAR